MALQLGVPERNAMLDAIFTSAGASPRLKIRTGTQRPLRVTPA